MFNSSSSILEEITIFIQQFIEIAGIVLLVLGALFCFAGYKLFKILLVIIGALAGALIGGLLTFGNPIGVLLGALVGALLNYLLYFIGIFLMGGLLALLVLFLLSFLIQIPESFYLVAAIAGGIFALVYEKIVMVISTSLNGAFLMAIGGYLLFVSPDLSQLLNGILMIPLWTLFLALAGIFVQLNLFSKMIPTEEKTTPPPSPGNPNISSGNLTRRVPVPDSSIIPLVLIQESGNNIHRQYRVNWRPTAHDFEAVIGKTTSDNFSDVAIPEPVISRRHAVLKQQNGQLFIQHLSNTNPTYLNNSLLKHGIDYPLNKGDRLILGDLYFKTE